MKIAVKKDFHFEKIYNFRDIGGVQTEDGRNVRSGILYRSDDLSRLSKNDLVVLKDLEIKVICDLRTVNERKSKMYQLPKEWGTLIKHIPIYHDSQDLTHRDLFRLLVGHSKEIDFEKMMKEFYHCMIHDRRAEIKEVIHAISSSDTGSSLIHCTGGKDRTGLISALIQLYLRVPYEKAMELYLHSNTLIGPRMKKIERMIRFMSLYQISPERIKPLLIVNRSYLEGVLKDIVKNYGSVENYFIEGCGIDKRILDRLQRRLLE